MFFILSLPLPVGIGLSQHVEFCFNASFLPCNVYTFWHAIPASYTLVYFWFLAFDVNLSYG